MLTTLQKATILRKAGVEIPASPIRKTPVHERREPTTHAGTHLRVGEKSNPCDETAEHEAPLAVHRWAHEIDNLFAAYSAARAARSLREAEAARQMVMLRSLASGSSD